MSDADYPGNRRAFPRWDADFSVTYQTNSKPQRNGKAVQVSVEGIALAGSEAYPPGTEINLHFELGEDGAFDTVGIVRSQDGDVMRVEFVRIFREQRLRMTDHFYRQS